MEIPVWFIITLVIMFIYDGLKQGCLEGKIRFYEKMLDYHGIDVPDKIKKAGVWGYA